MDLARESFVSENENGQYCTITHTITGWFAKGMFAPDEVEGGE